MDTSPAPIPLAGCPTPTGKSSLSTVSVENNPWDLGNNAAAVSLRQWSSRLPKKQARPLDDGAGLFTSILLRVAYSFS